MHFRNHQSLVNPYVAQLEPIVSIADIDGKNLEKVNLSNCVGKLPFPNKLHGQICRFDSICDVGSSAIQLLRKSFAHTEKKILRGLVHLCSVADMDRTVQKGSPFQNAIRLGMIKAALVQLSIWRESPKKNHPV